MVVCGGNVGVDTIGSVIEFGRAIAAVVGVVMIVGKHGIGKDKWGASEGCGRGGGSRASFGMIGGLRRCCKKKSLFHCIVQSVFDSRSCYTVLYSQCLTRGHATLYFTVCV